MRLTKICATIGPASSSVGMLRALVHAGIDVARLNFSHGTVDEHGMVARRIRAASRAAGRPVAILQDLQGPRIRIGKMPAGEAVLREGQRVLLGGAELPVTYARLAREVAPGARVLIKDGTVELAVLRRGKTGLSCRVRRGGRVHTGANLNAPDSALSVPALTVRDRAHLLAGAKIGFDAVALSFVRDAEDVHRARRILREAGSDALIVAKIESADALLHLDEILEAADGCIVARGDLGVECPVEQVPRLQKEIIRAALRARCFVITATQMLESMTNSATPTRAEVSDVANAVLDGTDAVMLSGETAVGKYPVEAVAAMDRIARAVETSALAPAEPPRPPQDRPDDLATATSAAAVLLAERARASAIVPFTATGRTAAVLAAYRPRVPILALSPREDVVNRLACYRGVVARKLRLARSRDAMFEEGVEALRKAGAVRAGDALVLVGGEQLTRGAANLVKVERVGG